MSELRPALPSQLAAEDEIDLRELFGLLWAGRALIVGVTAVAAVVSVVVALVMTEIYRAEATLAPADQEQASGSLAQFGGAAALLGVSLPGGGDSQVTNALATLRSRDFIIRFIRENDVRIPLFAGIEGDASMTDPAIYDQDAGAWLLDEGEPTDLEAYREFTDIFSVSQDNSTGLVTVAVEWHDPVLAARWVNALVRKINQEVKQKDQAEANSAIAYLSQQLESTQLVEMQRVFYDLIESQTRISMLTDVREEYVFQVVDPAVVTDEKIAPRRSLIAVLGTMLGAMLALVVVLIRHYAFSANEGGAVVRTEGV
ncbi:Wzz/FepE/Etk N-terminal domain-containing protein [Gammaproteobacteria bacterium]|nr:Wzz/FepE/Etk N-terminal domain-containing protein [Gammaproteobacteria bacterium]